MQKNQKGFTIIEIILIIAVLGLLGLIGWQFYQLQIKKNDNEIAIYSSNNAAKDKNKLSDQKAVEPEVLVKTTDGHAEFTLPTSWKVVQRQNGEDGQQYCGFAATDEAIQGTCLLDVTYQPSALDTGGQTFWYTKIFKTTKSPAKWYADVVGDCKNSQEKTLNGYIELICDNANYVVSNGQYLAEFVVFTDKAETKNYQTDFNSIVNSIKFN